MNRFFLLASLLILKLFAVNSIPASGPFKSTVTSIKNCENPTQPYIKDPPILFTEYVRNTTKGPRIDGNVTVLRETRNVEYKIYTYLYRNGTWQMYHFMHSRGCHGLIIQMAQKAMNIQYDRRNCAYPKGSYVFKNLYGNKLQHLWRKAMSYGRSLSRVEATIVDGTLSCKDIEIDVVPA